MKKPEKLVGRELVKQKIEAGKRGYQSQLASQGPEFMAMIKRKGGIQTYLKHGNSHYLVMNRISQAVRKARKLARESQKTT